MSRPQEQVLVTGGGGFLGRAICERLSLRGDGVTSYSRGGHPELEALGVAQIQGDIRDPEAVSDACRGKDVVFHVAAKPGIWGSYEDYFSINVTGTRNVLAACRERGVGRLIYTSSPSVVFDGSDMEGVDESVPYPRRYDAAYPATKAVAEQEVIRAGKRAAPNTISIRPHLIWGPRDNHLVPRILSRARQLARVGAGKNLVDTIYIDNAASAHVLASDQLAQRPQLSGRVYFVSQGEPIPLWDMVDAILAAGQLPPVEKRVPLWAAWTIGALLEALYKTFGIHGEPRMTRFVAKELATSHWFDISAARKDLNYRPEIGTGEGLKRLAEWLKKK